MHTPPNPDAPRPDGSTGEYPHAPPTPPGSSLVNLFGSSLVRLSADAFRPANTDDAPTVITPVVPAADAARPAVAGQKLGHFELIEAIGAGGMATVLKARDLELGRTVALKILPPDTARDPEAVTRFKQEARAAAKLDHDNVARVYFCGEDRGLHFIAFEFVEGENLRQRIDRLGRLTPAEAVRFMLQVAAGLGHAADRGVVHRDIKPSNILITSDGRAKIVDMGLARHLESHSVNGGVTQSGVTLGTFDYISPEQAMDPRRADVRSDIYSLGCAFYHALTGRPPVPEGTAAKKLHAHQHEAPTDPRDLNPAVPDGLAMVLARMMAKDPANRYPTPAELIADLSALGRELGLASEGTAETLALGSAARVPAVVGEPPRLPLGLLLGAAAVAVAAAVLFGRPTADPGPPRLPDPAAHTRAVAPDIAAGPPTSKPDAPAKGPVTPDNEAAFADAVNGAKETLAVALRPGHRYDLTRLKAGVLFAGKELTVEPQPAVPGGPTGPPVLVVAAAPPGDEVPAGGFAARGAKRVTLRGIDVRVAAPDGAPEMADPVGLLLAGAEQVVIDSCRVRATGKAAMFKIVGVAVEPPADPGRPADVTVRHTLFDLGPKGVGLRLPERAQASAADCGFGPHAAGIQLRAEEPATAEGAVRLVSCTFVVDRSGAAVAADAGASAVVSAAGCVFAAPVPPPPADRDMMPMTAADDRAARPVLLRLPDDPPGGVRYEAADGPPNAYFGVDPLAAGGRHLSFDEAAGLDTTPPPAADPRAVLLARPPWQHKDPRTYLGPDSPDPLPAFQLDIASQRRLHADGEGRVRVLGAVELAGPGQRIYTTPWPPPKPKPAVAARERERVVHPDAEADDPKARVYRTFEAAAADLQPDETLVLAANGPVPVPAGWRPKAARPRVRVVGHPDYRPVLEPDAAPAFGDPPLFAADDGEFTFVRVGLRTAGRVAALVRASGGATCAFRDCVLTLDDGPEPAAAVVLPNPAGEMRMGAADRPAGPQVTFDRCLVRGRGRAVWGQGPRPFGLAVTDSAAVLDGPFLSLDPGGSAGEPPRAAVRLARLTAVLAGPLVEVHTGRAGGGGPAVPAVEADRCLFAPLDGRADRRPLVLVEDADPTAEPRQYLSWTAAGPSVYAGYDRAAVLELRPPVIDGDPVQWSADRWRSFAGGVETAKVRFARRPAALTARPPDLRPTEAIDAGADPKDLPDPDPGP